jgi:hypothetical protein
MKSQSNPFFYLLIFLIVGKLLSPAYARTKDLYMITSVHMGYVDQDGVKSLCLTQLMPPQSFQKPILIIEDIEDCFLARKWQQAIHKSTLLPQKLFKYLKEPKLRDYLLGEFRDHVLLRSEWE